jgi:hypothetical protein
MYFLKKIKIFILVILIYKLAPPHGGASLLMNPFLFYPIFSKKYGNY